METASDGAINAAMSPRCVETASGNAATFSERAETAGSMAATSPRRAETAVETKPCAAQHRPAWMDRADKALRLESQPPVPGAEPLGLMAPRLTPGDAVTGRNSGQHRNENRYRRKKTQENQSPASYWASYEGNEVIPENPTLPVEHVGGMCPSGLAIDHPAYEKLLEYATGRCPVKTGRDWIKEEIHAAGARGLHVSVLSTEALEHFAAESAEKVATGYCRLVK